ncbi:hypothetical protein BsWGS_28779 [Bradybaena similaris]
MNLIGQR